MSQPAIGNQVRHLPSKRYGTVVTFYDDGDPMVRVTDEQGRHTERWPVADVFDCGRWQSTLVRSRLLG